MVPKQYIRILFVASFAFFLLNKFLIRPWVVATEQSSFFETVAYSLPNFVEAIMGTILITGILFYTRTRLMKNHLGLSDLSSSNPFHGSLCTYSGISNT
jgi:hypothetical protein